MEEESYRPIADGIILDYFLFPRKRSVHLCLLSWDWPCLPWDSILPNLTCIRLSCMAWFGQYDWKGLCLLQIPIGIFRNHQNVSPALLLLLLPRVTLSWMGTFLWLTLPWQVAGTFSVIPLRFWHWLFPPSSTIPVTREASLRTSLLP